MRETILLYNMERPEESDGYRAFCDLHHIALISVPREEYGVPLGFLAFGSKEQKAPYIGDKSSRPAKTGGLPTVHSDLLFSEPMMVFAGFTDPGLKAVLRGIRMSGLPGVSLKAVLTEHNALWDSAVLYEQLSEERSAFEKIKGYDKRG